MFHVRYIREIVDVFLVVLNTYEYISIASINTLRKMERCPRLPVTDGCSAHFFIFVLSSLSHLSSFSFPFTLLIRRVPNAYHPVDTFTVTAISYTTATTCHFVHSKVTSANSSPTPSALQPYSLCYCTCSMAGTNTQILISY
jgi:hypothetical protein